jgi:tetratricopeptide (TPR) repeat protein
VDLAAELSNAIDDPYTRDRLLIRVAEKCADLDDDEYALQLADAIEDGGLALQCRERIALIKANKGELDRAIEISASLVHPDYVYAAVAAAQASTGREALAVETISGIDFAAARVAAWQHIAAARQESGEPAKAVEALEQAAASAREIEHNEERIRTLCDIGNAFIEAKRSDKAIETFDVARADAELLDNVHRDFFLANCSLGFLYAGSDELADNTLDLVTDKMQMASALLGFAREQWKKDAKDDAVETLDEAYQILRSQRDTETRDSKGTNSLMSSIAAQFAGFARDERALEAAHENKDPAEVIASLTQIAQVQTVRKEDELARQTIGQIAEDADRVFALIQLSDTKARQDEKPAAIVLLDEALTMADSVPQMVSRSSILSGLAARYSDLDEKEKARRAALACLSVIVQIRDEAAQATALAELGSLYLEAGFSIEEEERRVIDPLLARADQ